MLYQLEKLNKEEKELILNAPAYITILIAGADDDISDTEIKRSLELVHIKTYSESIDVRDLYEKIDANFESRLNDLIHALPTTLAERETAVIEALTKLNAIFNKMDARVSHRYYLSLLDFSAFIARAAGGIFGIERVSFREEKFVKLPMIKDPNPAA